MHFLFDFFFWLMLNLFRIEIIINLKNASHYNFPINNAFFSQIMIKIITKLLQEYQVHSLYKLRRGYWTFTISSLNFQLKSLIVAVYSKLDTPFRSLKRFLWNLSYLRRSTWCRDVQRPTSLFPIWTTLTLANWPVYCAWPLFLWDLGR